MAPISEVEPDDFADTGAPIGNFRLVQAMIEMVGKVADPAVQIHGGGLVGQARKNTTSGGR